MAYSTVIKEEQLTKDELEKVKVGICPKCQEGLILDAIVKPEGSTLYEYDKRLGQWVADDFELEYELLGLCCINFACGFTTDADCIDEADVEKLI